MPMGKITRVKRIIIPDNSYLTNDYNDHIYQIYLNSSDDAYVDDDDINYFNGQIYCLHQPDCSPDSLSYLHQFEDDDNPDYDNCYHHPYSSKESYDPYYDDPY